MPLGDAVKLDNMQEIGALEAKKTLGTLLDRVEKGEEIVITRHGRPVARLVPHNNRHDEQQAGEALERIRSRAKALKLGRLDWEMRKKQRDAGRP